MNDIEESKLIKLSQQGNAEAFNALIERYQKEALNIAFRMLGNLLMRKMFVKLHGCLREFY